MRLRMSLGVLIAAFIAQTPTITVGAQPVAPFAAAAGNLGKAQQAAPLPSYFKTGILDFESRVWAQTQIERVYYNHRIWPKENPGPKPAFEVMVPSELIRTKVTDSLTKSAALEIFWQHPLTGKMLQAELDRMATRTRAPATLRELFKVLHHDPRLISETLVRETLSDRLIRNWYAYDTRFHAAARARAGEIAATWSSGTVIPLSTAEKSHHQIYQLDDRPARSMIPDRPSDMMFAGIAEFAALKRRFASGNSVHGSIGADPLNAKFAAVFGREQGLAPANLNIPRRSEETPGQFTLQRAVSVSDSRIELESVVILKVSFGEWWNNAAAKIKRAHAVFPEGMTIGWHLPDIISGFACNRWEKAPGLNNAAPDGRQAHTAVWTGSEMIVWGGYVENLLGARTGAIYNPVTESWYPTSTGMNSPAGRYGHIAVWTGREMIIWGGQGGPTNDGALFDPVNDTWRGITTASGAPEIRAYPSAVWTGAKLIVWGGYTGVTPVVTFLDTGAMYDPSLDQWSPTSTTNAPGARGSHAAVWAGGRMVIWGGASGDYPYTPLDSGGRYDPATDSWMATSTGLNVPSPRANLGAVWTGSEMIVWGGDNLQQPVVYFNSGGRYNPATDTWLTMKLNAATPSPRNSFTAIWTGAEMIVWGGIGAVYGYNSGGRYNPATDLWLETSTGVNVPDRRATHTAVWNGAEMIIWGGYGPGGFLGSGGRYSPATDNWMATSQGDANIPDPRRSHAAVWTGNEMMVWGGMRNTPRDFSRLNSGSRYLPATDSWQPTSTGSNVPSPRTDATAVWTGNHVIVWGGDDGQFPTAYLNTGGRYNPTTDSWSATSLGSGVPAGGLFHSAIWSGAEMIVWGGNRGCTQGTCTALNSGGRYDPNGDSWTPTSQVNGVPGPRYQHTAVWTGKEMIVWGGTGYSPLNEPVDFNSGARYDPVSGQWTATSLSAGVPEPRGSHVAAWTGEEMIVWGGGNSLISGGRYSPVHDSWFSTNAGPGVPEGLGARSAVWTGNALIIWGGYSPSGGGYNGGSRYYPSTDSWSPTSTGAYVPEGRWSHSAVWTGSTMIVWGTTTSATGGIYDLMPVASPGNSLRESKTASINLNWSTISGAGSYNVKRCNPGVTGCIPATILSTPTINQYSEPDDGISHFYAVEAVNQCGTMP